MCEVKKFCSWVPFPDHMTELHVIPHLVLGLHTPSSSSWVGRTSPPPPYPWEVWGEIWPCACTWGPAHNVCWGRRGCWNFWRCASFQSSKGRSFYHPSYKMWLLLGWTTWCWGWGLVSAPRFVWTVWCCVCSRSFVFLKFTEQNSRHTPWGHPLAQSLLRGKFTSSWSPSRGQVGLLRRWQLHDLVVRDGGCLSTFRSLALCDCMMLLMFLQQL